LAACPSYLDYEVAVLKSNISACHLKAEDWDEAVTCATKALECLDKLVPKKGAKKSEATNSKQDGSANEEAEGAGRVVELDSEDEAAEQALATLRIDDKRKEQIKSLRAKSLMRRAKANLQRGGWSNLASAEADFKETLELDVVPAADQKFIRLQLVSLGPKITEAKEKEMAEMMGKLKEVRLLCRLNYASNHRAAGERHPQTFWSVH
jgi:hypothetical protein